MRSSLALPLSFSSAENRHYAYTYDEVYSPVSIERIDEADEVKEERWKVISASYQPSSLRSRSLLFPISALLVYPHSSAGIRSRSDACVCLEYVAWNESVEPHYTHGERVSSTQSRGLALTRRRWYQGLKAPDISIPSKMYFLLLTSANATSHFVGE